MEQCTQCTTGFEINTSDRQFYQRMNVPPPSLCPDCRKQKRLAWRNERVLYKRKCDLTGKSTISFYHPNSPYKVYAQDEWWSDKWDPMRYGRDYDFNRPFFEQFNDLLKVVPHMSMVISHGENSDYCPYSVYYKDSYMCISGVRGENCYYCYHAIDCRNCVDCSVIYQSELCYECARCLSCYNSIFCKDCDNSSGLAFCTACVGCKNCIGCFGLRHKEYYIFNEQKSKEEYETLIHSLKSGYSALRSALEKHFEYCKSFPHLAVKLVNCEDSTGDFLFNCRNVHNSFLCRDLEDGAFCWNVPGGKDIYDSHYSTGEHIYSSMSAVNANNIINCVFSWDISDTLYSFQCFYGDHLLGCAGLKHKKYCILNKEYPKEEYKKLFTKIIQQMKQNGEYGDFFPIAMSPFPYNECISQDFFPITEKEALKKGWKWSKEERDIPQMGKTIPAGRLPDNINDIPDEVLNWAIKCEATKKLFKITPQELRFYRQIGLPVPHRHPDSRYDDRIRRMDPRKLWKRMCAKCGTDIQTTYSPDKPEKIYCESCYLKEVY